MRSTTLLIALLTLAAGCQSKGEAPPMSSAVPAPGGGGYYDRQGAASEDRAVKAEEAPNESPEPAAAPPAAKPVITGGIAGERVDSPAVARAAQHGVAPDAGGEGAYELRWNSPSDQPAQPPVDALSAALSLGLRGSKAQPRVDAGASDDAGKDRRQLDPRLRSTTEEKLADHDGILDVADREVEEDLEEEPEVERSKAERSKADKQSRDVDDGELGQNVDGKFARGSHTIVVRGEDPELFVPPATTLPRMFYFENTYLGGSAAYAERLRRLDQALENDIRPYEIVQAEVQPFDAPRTDGLGVTASIDATHFERARRVFLQVGLRGSSRYGWRRPPLDIVLVIDQPAFARGAGFVTGFIVELLRQLGPSDRLGIVLAGQAAPTFLDLARLNTAQQHLANRIDELAPPPAQGSHDLADAMGKAGIMLDEASDDEATVPGTKTLMIVSGEHDQGRIGAAARTAHDLTVQGCVTSVFALDAEQSEWWQVANAGFGNLHRISDTRFASALDEEMQSLARVVARLVRVNVRLGKDAKAIRVLGTRVLEQREVEEVKARELATDINLSKSLGITSDRGEDDDGIQTVIPYFYGDDSHVILIELWVEGPGNVADVTVRYKDMVNLDNATARTSVRLGARPTAPTRQQILIARNVRGFRLAENLQKASDAVWRNDLGTAVKNLGAAQSMATETNPLDVQAIHDLNAMVERGDWQNDAARRATLQETLLISGQRRVGDTNQATKK